MVRSFWRRIWNLPSSPARPRHHREQPRTRKLRLEVLEDRVCPSIYTVTSIADSGAGSLRDAITQANANVGTDTINFNISGTGVHPIAPTSALPTIPDPVIIDGYSQPGSSRNTLAVGDNAVLQIELSGASAGGVSGLVITAGNCTVQG